MGKSGPRSMTFTGCWTCKRRKVKCDERLPLCRNCERLGIQCDGYGIRLRWMDDPLEVQDGEKPVTSGGRIRIRRDNGPVYSTDAIDNFLVAIDTDAVRGVSSRKGPFSLLTIPTSGVFEPTRDFVGLGNADHDNGSVHLETSQQSEPPMSSPEEALFSGDSTAYAGSVLPDSADSVSPATTTFDLLLEPSILDGQDTEEVENIVPDDLLDDLQDDPELEVARSPTSLENIKLADPRTPVTNPTITIRIPPSISESLSGDKMVDRLMHHYVINIASLLQAVRHRSNPYRDVYAPAALQAASVYQQTQLDANSTVHSVILHSLLSSAAFHLWNCNPTQPLYHIVGTRYRQQALSLLRNALNSPMSQIEYRSLMVAMLSLVTVDVISGCEADFIVHLQGTKQLQSRRRNWRLIGKATRQLNEISDFLCMLARTMMFSPSGTPWAIYDNTDLDSREEAISGPSEGQSCFAYMYGSTPTLATYIEETCRLAEELDRYKLDKHIPEPLVEACEKLGDQILAWTFEGENLSTVAVEDDYITIFRYHATAWHQATLIYYYHRIQKCDASYYHAEIRRTAECMNAAEDMKLLPGVEAHTAPITWPALVASCDGLEREMWTRWWERVHSYRIANIQRQWEFVQTMWHEKDMAEARGDKHFDWIEVFKKSRLSLLPV